MTDTELLRQCIKESGLKLAYIADRLGISRFALTNKMENRTEFKPTEIKQICDLLQLQPFDRDQIFFA
jgi:hypothetical protein